MNKMIRVPASKNQNSSSRLDTRRRGLCTAEELVKLILRKYGISENELANDDAQPEMQAAAINDVSAQPIETIVIPSPQTSDSSPMFIASSTVAPATQQMTFCWE